MKKLHPVNINIESDVDSDDLGQRLVDCVKNINSDYDVVNLVKVHVGNGIPAYDFSRIIKTCIADPLKEMGATNCIFVPIKEGCIDDITIDYIEVRRDESNN